MSSPEVGQLVVLVGRCLLVSSWVHRPRSVCGFVFCFPYRDFSNLIASRLASYTELDLPVLLIMHPLSCHENEIYSG